MPDLDRYGAGGEVEALEHEVAQLLGTESAVFMPSGVMAQQAAMRSWAERSSTDAVAVHGLSHLVVHELDALSEMHHLRVQHLTDEPRPATVDDLDRLAEPLAAVSLEFPLRDAGYLLPSWEELVAFTDRARERGVPVHLDGARLWESQPFYDRPHAEIAALFDSVYVSFYKGLGGVSGAALAGPQDLVAQARRWRTRHGGTLFSMLPYAVGARDGLRRRLPRMAAYATRARELAAGLGSVDDVRVHPDPPHTNAFRVFVDAPVEALEEATLRVMETDHVALASRWRPAEVPGWAMTELTVGDATLDWDVEDQLTAMRTLVSAARRGARAGSS
ncbi:low specificity L-threonine aldolase [Phycicoccus sp. DTK01]|uniref:threonine aldolase family protein n=1 Tax=Phycicoccus sp. DTK01 TaxID=2785745 RepID=UPI001A9089EA|nr:beta-eliminating lyase-related protein [Phycicoccus sp. DTK01]GIL34229.1 threonine aldolase [Phycicoccus sp. DTK01]